MPLLLINNKMIINFILKNECALRSSRFLLGNCQKVQLQNIIDKSILVFDLFIYLFHIWPLVGKRPSYKGHITISVVK